MLSCTMWLFYLFLLCVKWQRKYSISSAGRGRLHFPGRLVAPVWGGIVDTLLDGIKSGNSWLLWPWYFLLTRRHAESCLQFQSNKINISEMGLIVWKVLQKKRYYDIRSIKWHSALWEARQGFSTWCIKWFFFSPKNVSWILHFPRCIIAVSRHSLSSCIDFCLGFEFRVQVRKVVGGEIRISPSDIMGCFFTFLLHLYCIAQV